MDVEQKSIRFTSSEGDVHLHLECCHAKLLLIVACATPRCKMDAFHVMHATLRRARLRCVSRHASAATLCLDRVLSSDAPEHRRMRAGNVAIWRFVSAAWF